MVNLNFHTPGIFARGTPFKYCQNINLHLNCDIVRLCVCCAFVHNVYNTYVVRLCIYIVRVSCMVKYVVRSCICGVYVRMSSVCSRVCMFIL